jgi:sporulation protein YqfD
VLWLEGRHPERALHRALSHGVAVRSVRSLGRGRLEVVVAPEMLAPLRRAAAPLARVRVRRRLGAPYALYALVRRPGLWVGAAAFALGLGALASMVWAVRVEGAPRALGERVLRVVLRQGVAPGAWRAAVRPQRLEAALVAGVPGVTWAAVRSDGGLVVVRVVPALRPVAQEEAARRLVASHAGRVVAVHVRQGRAEVTVGQEVRAGQALVTGYLAAGAPLADGSPGPMRWVAPRAVVVARWSERARAEVPLVRRGRGPVRWRLTWMVSVLGRTLSARPAPAGEVVARRLVQGWRIRVGGIECIALRVERVAVRRSWVHRLSPGAARAAAVAAAERGLARAVGSGARILRRQVSVEVRGDRAQADLRVEVEADVARAAGEAPAAGQR